MVELFHFNQGESIQSDDLQERFGLRGRNMLQLAALKTPIAPGFMVESSAITGGNLHESLTLEQIERAVKRIEELTGKTFNAPDRPMLFKVVISPSIQIGSLRSVHTIGINDEVAAGFANYCGEAFAYHEYRHFMEAVSTRFMGKKQADFNSVSEANPKASDKEICALYREKVVPDFPQNGYEQLRLVLTSMAQQYLDDPMNEDIEAGLMVQMMVYANFGEKSYNGNFYTRDIVTGEPRLAGYFGHNDFDTLPEDASDINEMPGQHLEELQQVATLLEDNFLDIRQIKFVIEEGAVWVVEQNPVDNKSTQAEVRTLLDLHSKELVTRERLAASVPPGQLQDLLHPVIDHATTTGMPAISGGLAGSPGAAVGRVCFSTPTLVAEYRRCSLLGLNTDLILMMPHTDAEDVEAIELGRAVVASVGGYASHAPVVARSLRKPCLLYEDIEFKDGHAIVGGNKVNELDTISLEVPTYTDPTIWLGKAELVYPDTSTNGLQDFMASLTGLTEDFHVLGSGNSPSDVDMALKLGAEGIGLFHVDSLLRREQPLRALQETLLMNEPDKRKQALGELEGALESEFATLFGLVRDRKLTVRLMNGPLTEFLPHGEDEAQALFDLLAQKHADLSREDYGIRINQYRNINPMLGLRGSRIGIAYPDLYEAQVAAILRAAYGHMKTTGDKVAVDVLIPGVMADAEMRFIRHGRNIESTVIRGVRGVEEDLCREWGVDTTPFPLRVGAMIELPAAALMSGHMAKQSDFFAIDTNMLTQTTNGMSYDDVNLFLPSFTQYDILKDNPFQILSTAVKELIGATVHFGKITRPDLQIGLSGDHASDPVNIEFAFNAKLGFVTCSPYGVPIAKLAAAQYLMKRKGQA